MNLEHLQLQYDRLHVHHRLSLQRPNLIAFLDLAHCCRIWWDMRFIADAVAQRHGVPIMLPVSIVDPELKKALRGARFIHVPIAAGVNSPMSRGQGFQFWFGGQPTEEQSKASFRAGPPKVAYERISFEDWLQQSIAEIPSVDPKHPRLIVSRGMLIKRIANFLGASHPMGTEEGSERENRFDPEIRRMHMVSVGEGYPLTFYALLDLSGSILKAFEPLCPAMPSNIPAPPKE